MSKKDIDASNSKPVASSRSPQSARRGNADPTNIGRGEFNLGMKNPAKSGGAENAHASELHENRKPYKPLYEPTTRK